MDEARRKRGHGRRHPVSAAAPGGLPMHPG
jgi:hypothetical protein